jgi:hypothetical protein
MSGLVMGGIVAAVIAAVGGGAFVSVALLVGGPKAERVVSRRRPF